MLGNSYAQLRHESVRQTCPPSGVRTSGKYHLTVLTQLIDLQVIRDTCYPRLTPFHLTFFKHK